MTDNEMRSILKDISIKGKEPVVSVDDITVYRASHLLSMIWPFTGEEKKYDGDFLVILKDDERAGLMHTCADENVYWYIAKKFRGQHVLSRVLRTNIIKKTWPDTKGITYIKPGKGRINHHLASEGGLIFRGPDLDAFHLRDVWPFLERPDFLSLKKNGKKADSLLLDTYSGKLADFTDRVARGDMPECVISKENFPKVLAWFSANLLKPRSDMHRVTVGWAHILRMVSEEVDVDITDADGMKIAKYLGLKSNMFGIQIDCDSSIYYENEYFLSREEYDERVKNDHRPKRIVSWCAGKYTIIRTGT